MPEGQKSRVAALAARLMNVSHRKALTLANSGLSWEGQPVPDSTSADQRRFEAAIAFVLTDAFREDLSIRGWSWAIQSVYPRHTGLDIYPVAGAEERLIGALLPRWDRRSGGLEGVAGLRAAHVCPGWWTLYSIASQASIRVAAPWTINPYTVTSAPAASWLRLAVTTAPTLSRREREYFRWEQSTDDYPHAGWHRERDLMLSRLLRRPGLARVVVEPHMVANIFQHYRMDIVFEWCCGPTLDEFHTIAVRSGLTAPIADLGTLHTEGPPEAGVTRHTVEYGCGVLGIRRNPACIYPDGVDAAWTWPKVQRSDAS